MRQGGALALVAILAEPASATTLGRPLNVADLVRRSSDIVVGTVTRVADGQTGGLAVVEVELDVKESIRGAARGRLNFRQLAPRAPERRADGRRYLGLVPGMPSYAKGDSVLLFLGPEGSRGLRTTVGLQQGRFELRAGQAENGVSNQGLFRGVTARPQDAGEAAMLATARGGVRADALIGLVRRAVAEQWWDGGVK